jgi:hypothetical protein
LIWILRCDDDDRDAPFSTAFSFRLPCVVLSVAVGDRISGHESCAHILKSTTVDYAKGENNMLQIKTATGNHQLFEQFHQSVGWTPEHETG